MAWRRYSWLPSMPRMGESMISMAGAAEFVYAVADPVDGLLAGFGVADDAAFAYVEAAGFELGFDEDDGFALPGFFRRARAARTAGRTSVAEMKETSMARKEKAEQVLPLRAAGWQFSEGGHSSFDAEEFAGGEEAGVGAFAEGDAGVVAELLGDLAVAGVDGEDGGGSGLEHAVGEAAGGGADVDAAETSE